MLRVAASERLDLLADQLAHQLADPLDDPMTPEWVVVASSGMDRWLRLALARRLGASAPGATDGVAANLDLLFPARLWARVLGTEADGDDPWQVDRLAWAVLDVLAGAGDDPRLRTLATLPDGATWWG
ncbi:MAG: exodeoxyribonuclease V subunit gamma, partial [Acidimicrobiales bacterium]|nr:exodeoxyribonuclease V subunit gamma [Acidimicrobiales bacterium]